MAEGNGNASSNSIASGSFSPSTGDLLYVMVRFTNDVTGDSPAFSTTLANVGTWTTAMEFSGGSSGSEFNTIVRGYAPITGSPGTGTVTCTKSGTTRGGRVIIAGVIRGHDTTGPVGQTRINTGTVSLGVVATVGFTSTPTAGSLGLAALSITRGDLVSLPWDGTLVANVAAGTSGRRLSIVEFAPTTSASAYGVADAATNNYAHIIDELLAA
jgi:hypothetical protein